MTKYRVEIIYPDGEREEEDELYDSYDEAIKAFDILKGAELLLKRGENKALTERGRAFPIERKRCLHEQH